jgi:hypothetical protein
MSQITTTEKQDNFSTASKKMFTVKKFANKNQQNGTWPDSESAIWAIRAGSPENGFGKAFITVGRRVLIDEENFWEAVSNLQETKNVSQK